MRRRNLAVLGRILACLLFSLTLSSCSEEKSSVCRYGWFGDEVLLLLQSGDGRSLVTVSIPTGAVDGYQAYLSASGREVSREQALVDLCGFPSYGFFGGDVSDLSRLRSLLDGLAIETGVSLTSVPTATQRIQALVMYMEPLRKTAMVDTLGKLAGVDAVDGLFDELRKVTACAGYDAGGFIIIDNTTDWERTRQWLALWLRQALASVQRSR